MKSYTDLKQSKTLSEILTLESADNVIVSFGSREGTKTVVMPKETLDVIRTPFSDIREVIPCWSLAALYGILPNNKKETTTLSRGGLKIEPIEYLDNWWCEYEDNNYTKDFTVSADNPVDACVEMIIKLKENKLL